MSNPNKAKGTRWEVAVRDFLRGKGFHVYRPAQEGAKDTGDLHGLPFFVVQCKAYKDMSAALRDGADGARLQAEHAGEEFGVAVIKRPRKATGEAYAVMHLDEFARLVQALDDARR